MYKKVIQFPNPILRSKTQKVKDYSAIENIIKDLIDTCNVEMAAGIAANQIGYKKSIVVIDKSKIGTEINLLGNEKNPKFLVLINPELELSGEDKRWKEECLSLSGGVGYVTRKEKAKLTYNNEKGEKIVCDTEWPFSGVLQHECDHLEGITFNFRMSRFAASRMIKKLKKKGKK